jgi:hypothetical protein
MPTGVMLLRDRTVDPAARLVRCGTASITFIPVAERIACDTFVDRKAIRADLVDKDTARTA